MLKMTYAQNTITPDLTHPVYMAGFGANKTATAVHDDLWVRVLALWLDGEQPVVLVTVDVIGLSRLYCEQIEQRVILSSGVVCRVLVACSHTHFGPDTIGLWGPSGTQTGLDEAYQQRLKDTIIHSCVAALKDVPQPVRLRTTAVEVLGLAKNFRDPDITDEEATLLQFVGDGDSVLATLVIYPCHPEALDPSLTEISADYVYALRQHIEAQTGGAALFMAGSLGGMMSPATTDRTHDGAAHMGEMLAAACLQALDSTPAEPVTHLSYDRRLLTLPVQNPLYEMAVEMRLVPQPWTDSLVTETGLIKIGPVWLVTIPGELLPKIGLALKARMRAAGAGVAGVVCLANDELGYILPEEDFVFPDDYFHPSEQYEESMSPGPQSAPLLLAALEDLFQQN